MYGYKNMSATKRYPAATNLASLLIEKDRMVLLNFANVFYVIRRFLHFSICPQRLSHFTSVQVTHLELEQAHAALVQSHSETNVTTSDKETVAAAVGEQRYSGN